MDKSVLRFYAGVGSPAALPLARYLPPLPPGMASAWLAENVLPGGWVLDPLGSSPALALEAARAGYRVIVACNNPVTAFMLETLAAAPKPAEFQSVLAELAVSKRGEERLEKHILRLYRTECDQCGESVPTQAFLWRKGETRPYGRIYHCPKCNEGGERPVGPEDIERLEALGGDKMHRSRALQRVILNEEEYRADVEAALESYLPRPLYVLFTLLNKAEGLGLPPERKRLLNALLISTFDAGSTLWTYPGGRQRPKQLTVPPQFRENNLWLALEEAAAEWSRQPAPIPLTRWPEPPPLEGGIALFRGRVKSLMPLPADYGPQAVVSVFPRPSQAFWTLSVLWAGWLWGPEAALPLRNVLDRRRYDWNWHTSAIHSALAAVGWSVPPGTPFFGLMPELVPGFLSAVVVAAEAAGFDLADLALRPEGDIAQGLWLPSGNAAPTPDEVAPAPSPQAVENITRQAMRSDMLERNEPVPYLVAYAAGLEAMARGNVIPRSLSSIPGDLLTRVQAALARTFADRTLLRLLGGQAEEERSWWWLASGVPPFTGNLDNLPLSDRVEIETVRFLQRRASFTPGELDQVLCETFTGLLTPPSDLVRACLDSYGEPVPAQPGFFRMQSSETAPARKADLEEMRLMLEATGKRLGYAVREQQGVLVWEETVGSAERWVFFRMASSIISRFVLSGEDWGTPEARRVLVLPGGRARLLAYKLRRDPRLAERAQGWHFLKFRHLRSIAARPSLTRAEWEALIQEDPLIEDATQMPLFSP